MNDPNYNEPINTRQNASFTFDWMRFMSNHPAAPLALLATSLFFFVLAFSWSFFFLSFLGITFISVAFYYHGVIRHHKKGVILPVKVVSESPFLLATYGDLSTGSSSYPAIKIHKAINPDNKYKTGDKTVALALYQGESIKRHWEDFSPKLIASSTNDQAAIAAIEALIKPAQWTAFEAGLSTLDTPTTPGLYRLFDYNENQEHEYFGLTREQDNK